MKVILSRKGFDSANGGYPSPILPEGQMLSLPIPEDSTTISYKDIYFNDRDYYSIMKDLKGNYLKERNKRSELTESTKCHFDPDIRKDTVPRNREWSGLYGQIGGPQTHLKNQGVAEGDLFLFFGWFKKTIEVDGKLKFDKNDRKGQHIIYGYLQIDKVITLNNPNQLEEWMEYHPHADISRLSAKNNTLYVAKKELSFIDNVPGYGTFPFNPLRVLTKPGHNKSEWALPLGFENLQISCHKKKNWENGYFQSNDIGQEFVIEECDLASEWAKSLFTENSSNLIVNSKEMNLSKVFDCRPEQWGLRGDPFLWEDLKREFSNNHLPYPIDKFESELVKEFRKKTGVSIFNNDFVHVKKYGYGGMSSGCIDVDTWRNKLIPLLICNLKKANSEGVNIE